MRWLPPADRFFATCVGALGGIVIVSHLLGATILQRSLWGTHAYGFLPGPALPVALLATLALTFAAARVPEPRPPRPAGGSSVERLALWAGLLLVAGLMLWVLRIRHTLLGDSGPVVRHLPLGEHTHPRQPLSAFAHHLVYGWARGLFEAPGRSPQDVAFDSVALDSVMAGVLLLPVAYLLVKRLIGAATQGAGPGEAGRPDPLTVVLATALLLTQGYAQLFFGYVENYTWFTLAIGLFLWAGMAFLAGRAPLFTAALALAFAIGLNISGIVFLPALGWLALWGLSRPKRRLATGLDLAASALIFLGLQLALAALGGFSAREGFRYMWDLVVRGEATNRSITYLLSVAHLRDFYAVQTLIGPVAGFFLLPAAAYRIAAPGVRDRRVLFMLLAALPAFVAAWMYGDSIQGLPRDWDLFAPFALPFTAAAIFCMASAGVRPALLRRLLAVATVISLFHTGAWIGLNTSVERSLERYKTLPATKGRTEMVVGYWYLTHGQPQLAREWFERAIAVYPANNVAHYELGLLAVNQGRYDDAIRHIEMAVEARPDKANYRLSLVDALVLSGRPSPALPHLEILTRAQPGRAELWGCAGIVLTGAHRDAQARRAFERAAALAPGDPRYAKLLARVGEPDAFARAVNEDWDDLVLK